jgi:hypothetical protein
MQRAKLFQQCFEELRVHGIIAYIFYFHNLNSKIISRFRTSIPTKKKVTKLFIITQQEVNSIEFIFEASMRK